MEPTNTPDIVRLEEKIDAIYRSVEQTRKYFLWTLITTAVMFILPLIGLMAIIPTFLDTYTSSLQELGL